MPSLEGFAPERSMEGGNKEPHGVAFCHRLGEQKLFNVGELSRADYSRKRIGKEIAKCDILCANCHAEETWASLV